MKISVLSLKEKTTQPWFSYFQFTRKYLKSFTTDLFNILLAISVLDY